MRIIICLVLMALAGTVARAAVEEDVHSARVMLPYCKLSPRQVMANPRNALMYGQCFGMISGIVTVSEVLRQARLAGKADIDPVACVEIPGDTSVLQLIDHVVKYGESHPEHLRDRLEFVAFAALHDAWPCPPPVSSSARRVALVIGNSQYRSAAFLPNPRRDAKMVADALRQVGFQSVELAMDLDRDSMAKALRAFRDQADNADWALIYFAGHGIEMDHVNYLVPVDAKLIDDRDVKAETVSYEEVLNAAGGAKMLRLLVLDACRVNPFKDTMRRTMASRSSTDRGLAPPPEAEAGTMVVYSAKDGEVADDDVDGVNSPFARAFVAELKVPGREVRRLFDIVRDDVLDATNKRQQPFTYGSLPGRRDFYFMETKRASENVTRPEDNFSERFLFAEQRRVKTFP